MCTDYSSPFLYSSRYAPNIVLFTPLGYSKGMHRPFSVFAITLSLGILLSAMDTGTVRAEVYKQVNPDGSITFTDVPGSKDEKPVPLRPMSTFKATPAPAISSDSETSKPASTKYTGVSVTSPANEATVRDNAGNLAVTASAAPGLQPGHKMVLLDNGSPQGESTTGNFKLSNIDRGTHVLTVQIQDSAGKVLIASTPVTVYLRRHSALH